MDVAFDLIENVIFKISYMSGTIFAAFSKITTFLFNMPKKHKKNEQMAITCALIFIIFFIIILFYIIIIF
jgi:RsiW-degrading membrane proteinase PrsW (M82 family)